MLYFELAQRFQSVEDQSNENGFVLLIKLCRDIVEVGIELPDCFPLTRIYPPVMASLVDVVKLLVEVASELPDQMFLKFIQKCFITGLRIKVRGI